MHAEQKANGKAFDLAGARLIARRSRALWWPDQGLLVVSDLHLGKSERIARRGGALLPPYDTTDTLTRLDAEIAELDPSAVLCLGDSFDDDAVAEGLTDESVAWLTRMMAGREWTWIEGNHDPGPVSLGGSHRAEQRLGPLTFRHIADPEASAEVSGHYHPKATLSARGAQVSRPCFLHDSRRVILPAFGTFTGGLRSTMPVLNDLMGADALAILTGPAAVQIPMPGRPRQGRVTADET